MPDYKKETYDKCAMIRKSDSVKFQKNAFKLTSKNIRREAKFSVMTENDSNEDGNST